MVMKILVGHRYVLVKIDNSSKFWMDSSNQKKIAITKKDSFEKFLSYPKRTPNLIESNRGKDFYKNIFQNCIIKNNITQYSKTTYLGAVFAERFVRSIRDILKKPVFENGESSWIDVLPTITKRYNNGYHTSTKLTPIEASL